MLAAKCNLADAPDIKKYGTSICFVNTGRCSWNCNFLNVIHATFSIRFQHNYENIVRQHLLAICKYLKQEAQGPLRPA